MRFPIHESFSDWREWASAYQRFQEEQYRNIERYISEYYEIDSFGAKFANWLTQPSRVFKLKNGYVFTSLMCYTVTTPVAIGDPVFTYPAGFQPIRSGTTQAMLNGVHWNFGGAITTVPFLVSNDILSVQFAIAAGLNWLFIESGSFVGEQTYI